MLIIATVHKNPLDLERVREILDAGADILRIKFSHISDADILEVVKKIRKFIFDNKYSAKILADLPENKIRLGQLEKKSENVYENKIYTIKSGNFSTSIENFIPITLEDFTKYFSLNDHVLVGDGELAFTIKEIVSPREMKISFLNSGVLGQYRSIMSSRLMDSLDHEKISIEKLSLLKDIFPEYLSLSFVNSASYINNIKNRLRNLYGENYSPLILAKIESQAGLDNIEEIINVSDMIVIARGDLALTTDYKKLILEQKRICKLCNEKGRPVIVATQILESCLTNTIPSRSDLADISNIVLDGADGVWFSKETSANDHPGRIIKIAKDIFSQVNYQSHT